MEPESLLLCLQEHVKDNNTDISIFPQFLQDLGWYPEPVYSHPHPVSTYMIHFNISFTCRLCIYFFYLPHTCCMCSPFILPDLVTLILFGEVYSLCKTVHLCLRLFATFCNTSAFMVKGCRFFLDYGTLDICKSNLT